MFWQAAEKGTIEKRWLAQISMFDFTVHNKRDEDNICAGYLPKHPVDEPQNPDEDEGDATFCNINATMLY